MVPGQRAGSGKAAAGFRGPRPSAGWYGEWLVLVELLFCLRADVRHGGIWLVGGEVLEIGPDARVRGLEIVMYSTRESNMVAGRRRPSREPRMGRLLRPRSAPSLGIKPLILTTRLSSDQDP